MDIVDVTARNEEVLMSARIANMKGMKQDSRCKPDGYCHYCGEKLDNPEARWCDAECRDAWEKEVAKYGYE